MILTCPSCGTQYAVKDGAIPPQGRQVRCASCKHAWHQDPEGGPAAASTEEPVGADAMATAPPPPVEPGETADATEMGGGRDEYPADEPPGYAPVDPVAPPGDALVEDAPATGSSGEWSPPPAPTPAPQERREEPAAEQPLPAEEPAYEEDFSPFTMEEHEPPRRSPLLTLLMIALLIAALAAAFWFLAPASWKERVGIAAAGETPLQLMMTHSDRQKIAPSGNEMLSVSGRVINPTDEAQNVPPIHAQLRSSAGKLVYSWTIGPPARTLPPRASKTFNSTEVNVPPGGDELTITLGSGKA